MKYKHDWETIIDDYYFDDYFHKVCTKCGEKKKIPMKMLGELDKDIYGCLSPDEADVKDVIE